MTLHFKPLHPSFMAEVSPVDLRTLTDQGTLASIRAAMTEFGVLVFHDQHFSYDDQIDFAQRLDIIVDIDVHEPSGEITIQLVEVPGDVATLFEIQ